MLIPPRAERQSALTRGLGPKPRVKLIDAAQSQAAITQSGKARAEDSILPQNLILYASHGFAPGNSPYYRVASCP